jgi:hypothetical protein
MKAMEIDFDSYFTVFGFLDGIKNLLEAHAYLRKYTKPSAFDDWYVRKSG